MRRCAKPRNQRQKLLQSPATPSASAISGGQPLPAEASHPQRQSLIIKVIDMERILFGDNQFFGVNHLSEERGRAQAIKFQDNDAVMRMLDDAFEEGINVFMCTTHDRISQICNMVRVNPARYKNFQFYPCMPYAHKYANAVTELGMIDALKHFLPDNGVFNAMFKGGVAVARKDVEALVQLLVEAEMKMFDGLSTPVIFLQNVVTDLLLGLGFNDALRMFSDHVKTKYGAEPGFITMNLPKLIDVLEQVGIDNPIVCSNINKIGFRMCGGIDAYEKTIATKKFRAVAMSVFASGAIAPEEALEYICAKKEIESIVFGASSRKNIRQTRKLIEKMSPPA